MDIIVTLSIYVYPFPCEIFRIEDVFVSWNI